MARTAAKSRDKGRQVKTKASNISARQQKRNTSKATASTKNVSGVARKSRSGKKDSLQQVSMDTMVQKMRRKETEQWLSRREKMQEEDGIRRRSLSSDRESGISLHQSPETHSRETSRSSKSHSRMSSSSRLSNSIASNNSTRRSRKRQASTDESGHESSSEESSPTLQSRSRSLTSSSSRSQKRKSRQSGDEPSRGRAAGSKQPKKRRKGPGSGKENKHVLVTTAKWKPLQEPVINYCREMISTNIDSVVNSLSRQHAPDEELDEVRHHLNTLKAVFLRHLRQKTAPKSTETPTDYRNMEQQLKMISDISADYEDHNERLNAAIDHEENLADEVDAERKQLQEEAQTQRFGGGEGFDVSEDESENEELADFRKMVSSIADGQEGNAVVHG